MHPGEPPKDHVDDPEPVADPAFDDDLPVKAGWQRLLFMFVMAVLFGIGVTVGCLVALMQFFWVLFYGETKPEFSTVGRQLGEYARQIALYMTFNTEERPFPFDRDWPAD